MVVYQVVRVLKELKLNDGDLIQMTEAARLVGMSPSGIARMMDTGKLPDYRLLPHFSETLETPRYTSRAAVEALGDTQRSRKPRAKG